MIALAWIIFGVFILCTILLCFLIVKYYQDRNEAELLPTWTTVLGLSVTLFCVLLIPVDIYNVSSSSDPETGEKLLGASEIAQRSEGIKVIYYFLYASILAFAFGFIPFAYFYYEEADEETTTKGRIWAGCKYTIFLIIIVAIMLVIGLILYFVKPNERPTSTEEAQEWAQHLLHNENIAEAAISFAVACLTLLGYLIWITYTAYGLSAFPIGTIKGRKHLIEEYSKLQNDIESTKTKQSTIRSKYLGGKKVSKRDEERLDLLKRKERALSRQGGRLDAENTGWRKVWSACKPFMFIFGILFFLVSLLIVVSILLTNSDKAVHSHNFCGAKCGFILAYPEIFNPVDTMLTLLAKFFPVDYVILAFFVVYIFFCTLSGIIQIGVRFLWLHLFSIRKGATPPQGLLISCIILMLATLALNMEVTTLAPQYANFGTQTWYNETSGKIEPCSLQAPVDNCTMTQIGTFVNRISVRTSFFGVVFFYATWLFLAAFFIGAIVAIFKAKPNNVESRDSDEDEPEY